MLYKGTREKQPGSTLIVGDSHAVYGVVEKYWENAINCSVESQDLFYDFLCIKEVIEKAPLETFSRCIMICGYYVPYQDLSLNTRIAAPMVNYVYYPIFNNPHHFAATRTDFWDVPGVIKTWESFSGREENVPDPVRELVDKKMIKAYAEKGTYFGIMNRVIPAQQKGRLWGQLHHEEKTLFGLELANKINDHLKYEQSLIENKKIFQDIIDLLYAKSITPIFVTPPFAKDFNVYIAKELKDSVGVLLDSVSQPVHYIDFNDSDLFSDMDFMDTNHLAPSGAEKFSASLADLFGK